MARTDFGTHTHTQSLSHTVILTPGRHTQTFPISNLSLSNLIFIILSLALSLSPQCQPTLFSKFSLLSALFLSPISLFVLSLSLSFPLLSLCISYKGSRQYASPENEATNGKYANESSAAGLEWDTIYPKS